MSRIDNATEITMGILAVIVTAACMAGMIIGSLLEGHAGHAVFVSAGSAFALLMALDKDNVARKLALLAMAILATLAVVGLAVTLVVLGPNARSW